MSLLIEIKNILYKYKNLGAKFLDDGTQLIGKAPHAADQAWLHCFFPSLNSEEILKLQLEYDIQIPEVYKNFLMEFGNGLHIFVDAFSLDGYRKKEGREIDSSWQPYSLKTPNLLEKPKGAKENHFFIGGYNWDASKLYIDIETNKVYRCLREDITPKNEWSDLETMILSEVKRMCSLHDDKGIEKNINLPTTP